jgi:hypothetical protein
VAAFTVSAFVFTGDQRRAVDSRIRRPGGLQLVDAGQLAGAATGSSALLPGCDA